MEIVKSFTRKIVRLPKKVLKKCLRIFNFIIVNFRSSKIKDTFEFTRLKSIPRFTPTEANLTDIKFSIPDAASFIFQKGEIIDKEIYKFNSKSATPLIIDCGANIGLSVFYFAKNYPTAKVIGFEPDTEIFKYLESNTKAFKNVELINKAVLDKEGEFRFYAEGADGGRIALEEDQKNITTVKTVRLRDYLRNHVDMLKIDIEGSEDVVIKDCTDLLKNVDNIFIEYHSFCRKQQTLGEILGILTKNGFRYYIEHIGIVSPQPFFTKHEYMAMDNQLNIFANRK